MADLINEKTVQIDGRSKTLQYFSDGSQVEIIQANNCLCSRKEINADGSYLLYNSENVKIKELTVDGLLIKYDYQTGKKKEEISKNGEIKTFYENGNILTTKTTDGEYFSYFENGDISEWQKDDYEVKFDSKKNKLYEFKDGNLYVNPDYFSYYKIGVKTKDNETHWQEKTALNPKKKTLLCLGGDQTKDAKAANGNINAFAYVLGLSQEQLDSMQLCSCYRPYNWAISRLFKRIGGTKKQINDDYRREILQKFMPYMAQIKGNEFVKYSGDDLADNFRNIIIQAHCAGANDLPKFAKVFNETMTQLGYTEQEKSRAMQQIVCITNNSQREFTDDLGFTSIHRYSVKDGQFEPEYEEKFSDGYPVFLQKHSVFSSHKGRKASFVSLKSNEMLMIFDRVLEKGNEHNDGFWTTTKEFLTTVGKQQAKLMKQIGQFWFNNKKDISSAAELVKQASKGTKTEKFVDKSFESGKKLKSEQRNVLKNSHILKKVWNEFNSPNITPQDIGIFKVLSKNR